MRKKIDCLLIGHNQQNFEEYEKEIRGMGITSGAYRDLSYNTIQYNGKHYNASDVFNLFCCNDHSSSPLIKPLGMVETFSAAIAYLGSYLHRRGFTFDYINSFQEEKDLLAEKLIKENIQTIAVTTTLYVSCSPVIEIINFIKEYNQTAKIVIGGPFISTKARTLKKTEFEFLLKLIEADFYVNSSQGEATLVKIIDALNNHLPLDQINNIYYKSENGKAFVFTQNSKENNRLAENLVNWDLFADKVGDFVNLRTALSCPFTCAFCGFPQHAGKYQIANVDAIEKELNLLDKIESVKSVTFIDDTFNFPVKRSNEILRMLIKNNYKFKWNSFLRCQFLDKESVALMKESGCESVFLGLESGNNQMLKNMNKKVLFEEYLERIALLKEYGIITFGNFIIGFPGETSKTVQDTIRFIKESELDFYRAQLWYCEPITPVWRQREKYNLKGDSFEWSHDTMNSKEAGLLLEKMIIDIEKPTRYPQYYFDYDNVIQLTYKGLKIKQVKKFLDSFNLGIKEKLLHSSQKEVSYQIIEQIHQSCCENINAEYKRDAQSHKDCNCDAEFNF